MGKLLDFTPPTVLPSGIEVGTSLYDDVWFSCTPDLPALRYAGRIPVFIWDEIKTYKEEASPLTKSNSLVDTYLVLTKDKYTPFRNAADKPSTPHDLLLPSNPDWAAGVKGLSFTGEKKQLAGRLLHVSLEGIQALDRYYLNTALHERKKVPVVMQDATKPERVAWMYTLPTRSFMRYAPHEESYEMVRGFEPQQCSSLSQGQYTSTYTKRS